VSYWVLIVHSGIDTHTSRSYKFLFLSDFAYFVPTVATFCILCLFEYFFLVVVIKVVITSAVDYLEKPLSKMSYYMLSITLISTHRLTNCFSFNIIFWLFALLI